MEASESVFPVMGSTAQVVAVGAGVDLLDRAAARLRYLEGIWTRFSDGSEVSQLNSNPGDWIDVTDETVALIELSRLGWLMTGGLFDPTGLPALLAAGYVSSRLDETRRTEGVEVRTGPAPGCAGIETGSEGVRLPVGVTIDPGGIGKGLAADIVATELIRSGAAAAMVNVGGDLRVVDRRDEGGWSVGLEDPFDEGRTVARLRLGDGGVATSTPRHRRWRAADGSDVHVMDPRTGRPVETDVASATVLAGEAWMAEVVAKGAVIAGCDAAAGLIDDLGLAGVVISDRGKMMPSSRAVEYLL